MNIPNYPAVPAWDEADANRLITVIDTLAVLTDAEIETWKQKYIEAAGDDVDMDKLNRTVADLKAKRDKFAEHKKKIVDYATHRATVLDKSLGELERTVQQAADPDAVEAAALAFKAKVEAGSIPPWERGLVAHISAVHAAVKAALGDVNAYAAMPIREAGTVLQGQINAFDADLNTLLNFRIGEAIKSLQDLKKTFDKINEALVVIGRIIDILQKFAGLLV